ncbi:MAG: AEC family transporter [Verrucomicrobiales bacterium]|nr:AEC family transporter [Verrucomicrobiales bacterium]
MTDLLALLLSVVPVLGVIATGFAIRRLEWLSDEADASLMRVVINLLTPCLIADSILGNPAFARADNVFLPPLLGFVTTAGGILVGWWLRRGLGREATTGSQRTFATSAGICNYGYIPLPLAQVFFTSATVGVLFVLNIGVELAMWLVGLAMINGRPWREGWRYLANPPVFSILGTLALNAWVPRASVPAPLMQWAHLLGQCAIPLGLLVIGATVADLLPELKDRTGWRVIGWACVVRLAILPAAILALAWALPASREVREVLLLHAAMPAAVFPIVMARHFGGDAGTALRVVLGTSIASVVTMPLWLKFGMRLLNLGDLAHP